MENIRILYLDAHLVACEKPVGMVSEEPGLPRVLREQLGGEICCVHRLDKGVGGVMVYARTAQAAGKLSAMVAGREIRKEYLAVCEGRPDPETGELRDLLFHDSQKNKSFVVKRERKGVREAVLNYEVLSGEDALSLVHVTLQTGRTHQIRVQFASRKHPLAGDSRYGSRKYDCPVALWSCRMTFRHPITKKPVTVESVPAGGEPWNRFSGDLAVFAAQTGEPHSAAPCVGASAEREE